MGWFETTKLLEAKTTWDDVLAPRDGEDCRAYPRVTEAVSMHRMAVMLLDRGVALMLEASKR